MQRRIQGCLDLPLSDEGRNQAERAARELADERIDHVYAAPCSSSQETADLLARNRRIRITALETLRNLDYGLWHGKLIDDVKRQQPRVFRLWQESPQAVCPPEGETWTHARERVSRALHRVRRRHRDGVVALVVSEPVAAVIRSLVGQDPSSDVLKADEQCGRWEWIDLRTAEAV